MVAPTVNYGATKRLRKPFLINSLDHLQSTAINIRALSVKSQSVPLHLLSSLDRLHKENRTVLRREPDRCM